MDFIEEAHDAKIQILTAVCPDCGVDYERDSVALMTDPITFSYKCPKCGRQFTSHSEYPKIQYCKE